MRKRLWAVWVMMGGVLVVGAVLTTVWYMTSSISAPGALRQIAKAFVTYAESKGDGKYPSLSSSTGVFLPDMTAFGPTLAGMQDGQDLMTYLTGGTGVDLCYVGYVVMSQRSGLVFLDAYQKQGVNGLADSDIPMPHVQPLNKEDEGIWPGEDYWEELIRLKVGVERFFFYNIGNLGATSSAQSAIPILWEMPDNRRVPGGWVVFLSGDVQWEAYPGNFPMTVSFISRVRALMPREKTPRQPCKVVSRLPSPRQRADNLASPVYEMAIALPNMRPLGIRCDKSPSVWINGFGGYVIETRDLSLQNQNAYYPELPPEFILFPLDCKVSDEFRKGLALAVKCRPGGPVYMGDGSGYRWFATEADVFQDRVRDQFALSGGDDPLEVLASEIRKGGNRKWSGWRGPLLRALPKFGARAIPLITSIIEGSEDGRELPEAFFALDAMAIPESEAVIRGALAPDNTNMARNAEAIILSLDPGWPRVRPKVRDTTIALAKQALRDSKDYPNVARVATRLYLHTYGKGVWEHHPLPPVNRIGKDILQHLPRDVVRTAFTKFKSEWGRHSEPSWMDEAFEELYSADSPEKQ